MGLPPQTVRFAHPRPRIPLARRSAAQFKDKSALRGQPQICRPTLLASLPALAYRLAPRALFPTPLEAKGALFF